MVITLDGPSGTGKSTLAKLIAKKLGFKMLNTGMIYRAITYYYIKNAVYPNNLNAILDNIDKFDIVIKFEDDNQHVYINDKDYTAYVNDSVVQKNVSLFSEVLAIRERVAKIQRDYAKNEDVVIEGRDIGTAIFPDAKYKFYVTCDINVRAKRRFDDLKQNGKNISLDEVIASLENRDRLDSSRKYGKLQRAKDATLIDTSNSSLQQTLDEILSYINE